jgi:hypothetical protein
MRTLPNFGELYGWGEEPSYVTDQGVEVWMYRKGQRVRFFDRAANQIGPEHHNVYPATVWLFFQGWSSPRNPEWFNAGC